MTLNPETVTPTELYGPSVDAAMLAKIAATRPDLWTAIQGHPACYPELAQWITQQQTAVAAPVQGPSMQGANDLLMNRVGPSNPGATRPVQNGINEHVGLNGGARAWLTSLPQILLLAVAFILLVSVFLPVASLRGYGSVGYFSDELGGSDGPLLLVIMIITIAFGVCAILTKMKWLRITTAIIGIIAGLLAAITGFGGIATVSGQSLLSLGAAPVMLAVFSMVLIVVSIVTLIPKKSRVQVQPARPQ